MAVAFDTLRAARRLRDEGGFDEKQAAILVDTLAEGMGESVASKGDILRLEGALRELEQRMTIRLGGMMAVGLGMVVALIKLV